MKKWADIKISTKRSTYLVAETAERCQYHTGKKMLIRFKNLKTEEISNAKQ